jgi:Ca2+/Na+ antiporter
MPFIIMIVSAFAIIGIVKFGLVPGIDRVSLAQGWSLKARGKATGYATSVPELVALVAVGLSGVWDAGLWNIASSNLINLGLATTALVVYRRGPELMDRRFAKELSFAGLGIAAPLIMMQFGIDTHPAVIVVLLACFALYIVVDKSDGELPTDSSGVADSGPWRGLALCAVSLGLIVLAGKFLGASTRDVVHQMGVPAIAAGWILGFVTSLPEAVTFFEVFSTKRAGENPDHKAQIQELLDNLSASNMSNSGLIYPLGLAIYLLGGGL